MASMCEDCIYFSDEDGFCIALDQSAEDVEDDDCDCYEPMISVEEDDETENVG